MHGFSSAWRLAPLITSVFKGSIAQLFPIFLSDNGKWKSIFLFVFHLKCAITTKLTKATDFFLPFHLVIFNSTSSLVSIIGQFFLKILIPTCNYLLEMFHQLENSKVVLIDTLICLVSSTCSQIPFKEMNTFMQYFHSPVNDYVGVQ